MRRLTVSEVAEHCNVTREWMSRVINGRSSPDDMLRQQLCTLLELQESELFRSDEPEPSAA